MRELEKISLTFFKLQSMSTKSNYGQRQPGTLVYLIHWGAKIMCQNYGKNGTLFLAFG